MQILIFLTKPLLQNGAKLFMNYCSGCHEISLMRYNRIAKDLNLTEEHVAKNLMFAGNKVGQAITTAMPEDAAAKWFGGVPPDLSLVSRSKGTDWIYTYLRSFYDDEEQNFWGKQHSLGKCLYARCSMVASRVSI